MPFTQADLTPSGTGRLTALSEALTPSAGQSVDSSALPNPWGNVQQKTAPKPGGWRGLVGHITDFAPIKYGVLKPLSILDYGRRAIISGVREVVDAVDFNPNTHASASDWLRQTKNPNFGFGTAFHLTNNVWANRLFGFVGDAALDPLTHASFGGRMLLKGIEGGGEAISVASREGKVLLADRAYKSLLAAGTAENVAAEAAASIAEKGAYAARQVLTDAQQAEIGLARSGVYMFGHRIQAVRIPFTGGLGQLGEAATSKLRLAALATKPGGWLQELTMAGPDGASKAARLMLARGELPPEKMAATLAFLGAEDAKRAGLGAAHTFMSDALHKAFDGTGLDSAGVKDAVHHVIENPALLAGASPGVQRAAQAVADFFGTTTAEFKTVLNHLDPSATFKELANYFPHQVTNDVRTFMDQGSEMAKRVAREVGYDPQAPAGFTYERKLVEGGTFFGTPIRQGEATVAGLNKIANDAGFVGNFFETDVHKVLEQHASAWAHQMGVYAAIQHLADHGVVNGVADLVARSGLSTVTDAADAARLAGREVGLHAAGLDAVQRASASLLGVENVLSGKAEAVASKRAGAVEAWTGKVTKAWQTVQDASARLQTLKDLVSKQSEMIDMMTGAHQAIKDSIQASRDELAATFDSTLQTLNEHFANRDTLLTGPTADLAAAHATLQSAQQKILELSNNMQSAFGTASWFGETYSRLVDGTVQVGSKAPAVQQVLNRAVNPTVPWAEKTVATLPDLYGRLGDATAAGAARTELYANSTAILDEVTAHYGAAELVPAELRRSYDAARQAVDTLAGLTAASGPEAAQVARDAAATVEHFALSAEIVKRFGAAAAEFDKVGLKLSDRVLNDVANKVVAERLRFWEGRVGALTSTRDRVLADLGAIPASVDSASAAVGGASAVYAKAAEDALRAQGLPVDEFATQMSRRWNELAGVNGAEAAAERQQIAQAAQAWFKRNHPDAVGTQFTDTLAALHAAATPVVDAASFGQFTQMTEQALTADLSHAQTMAADLGHIVGDPLAPAAVPSSTSVADAAGKRFFSPQRAALQARVVELEAQIAADSAGRIVLSGDSLAKAEVRLQKLVDEHTALTGNPMYQMALHREDLTNLLHKMADVEGWRLTPADWRAIGFEPPAAFDPVLSVEQQKLLDAHMSAANASGVPTEFLGVKDGSQSSGWRQVQSPRDIRPGDTVYSVPLDGTGEVGVKPFYTDPRPAGGVSFTQNEWAALFTEQKQAPALFKAASKKLPALEAEVASLRAAVDAETGSWVRHVALQDELRAKAAELTQVRAAVGTYDPAVRVAAWQKLKEIHAGLTLTYGAENVDHGLEALQRLAPDATHLAEPGVASARKLAVDRSFSVSSEGKYLGDVAAKRAEMANLQASIMWTPGGRQGALTDALAKWAAAVGGDGSGRLVQDTAELGGLLARPGVTSPALDEAMGGVRAAAGAVDVASQAHGVADVALRAQQTALEGQVSDLANQMASLDKTASTIVPHAEQVPGYTAPEVLAKRISKQEAVVAVARSKYDTVASITPTFEAQAVQERVLQANLREISATVERAGRTRVETAASGPDRVLVDGKSLTRKQVEKLAANASKAQEALDSGVRTARTQVKGQWRTVEVPLSAADRSAAEKAVQLGAAVQPHLTKFAAADAATAELAGLAQDMWTLAGNPARGVGVPSAQWDKMRAVTASALNAEYALTHIADTAGVEAALATPQAIQDLVSQLDQGWTSLAKWNLPGLALPSELHDMMVNVKRLDDPMVAQAMTKLFGWYTPRFKAYALSTPGFHIRNLISNVFSVFSAGAELGNMKDAETLFQQWFHARGSGNLEGWLASLGDRRQPFEEALKAYHAAGPGQQSSVINALAGTAKGSLIDDNAWLRWNRRVGERIEGSARFMLAYDGVQQGMDWRMAAVRVRRHLFDYSGEARSTLDKTMGQIVPFWTYMSRNLPTEFVNRYANPRAYAIYNSLMRNVNSGDSRGVPTWMSENGSVPFSKGWLLSPDIGINRFNKTMQQLQGDPVRLLADVNPILRVPLELYGNRRLSNGVPFSAKDQQVVGGPLQPAVEALLTLLGQTHTGTSGGTVTNSKANYAVTGLVPTLAQTERLLPATDFYKQKQLTSFLSWLGVPVSHLSQSQLDAEATYQQKQAAKLRRAG